MAGSPDSGLDLHLPWGRPSPPGPERPERAGNTGPERPERAGNTGPERPERNDTARSTDPDAEPDPVAESPAATPLSGLGVDVLDLPGVDLLLAGAATSQMAGALERLQLKLATCFERLEERADAYAAGSAVSLEKLEARLEAAHAASVEAVGLLAGQVMAGLEEQIARLDATLAARHQLLVAQEEAHVARHVELLAKIDAALGEMVDAIGGLASTQLIDKLLGDVVATGEVLDAELIDLKRMLHEQRLASPLPCATNPAGRREGVEPST